MDDLQEIADRLDEKYLFKLGSTVYELDLTEFPIDDTNLSGEFVKQPSLYVYVAVLVAKANAKVKSLKAEKEQAEAQADIEVRKQFDMAGEKYTEAKVSARVILRVDVQEAERKFNLAQEEYDVLRAVEAAYRMRAEMLISLGAHQRADFSQTDMHVKDPADDMRERIREMREAKKESREDSEEK